MVLTNKNEIKTSLIKKHVNAIHCSNNLTLVQRKIFNALLLNAYHHLPTTSHYDISIKYLCELIGYDSRDYKKLKRSLLDLITTAIEWNVIDQCNELQDEKWRASSIISAAKIENGICTYEFSSIMRELLYRPEIYGKIDVKVMVAFKSGYGLALYENCIRFQTISQTPWLPIALFRKLMGVADNHYHSFCDLKKRVLDIALKEVNEYSPIQVIPEIKRANKKVISIRFKLANKQNQANSHTQLATTMIEEELIHLLTIEFGLSLPSIEEMFSHYDTVYIKEKVHLVRKSESFRSGKIRELAAYLIDALKRDYRPSKSSNIVMTEKHRLNERTQMEEKKNQEEQRHHDHRATQKRVDDYLKNKSQEDIQQLMQQFEHYLQEKDRFYLWKKYQTIGIHAASVRAVFNSFIKDWVSKEESASDNAI